MGINFEIGSFFNWNGVQAQREKIRTEGLYSPMLCYLDDGVPEAVDELKALGNAQVPRVVEVAWKILSGETE